jgi:hypothetical protein
VLSKAQKQFNELPRINDGVPLKKWPQNITRKELDWKSIYYTKNSISIEFES